MPGPAFHCLLCHEEMPRCGEGSYSNNLNSTAYRGHLRWCSGALLGSDSETEVCGSPNNINDNGSTIEDEYGRGFSRPLYIPCQWTPLVILYSNKGFYNPHAQIYITKKQLHSTLMTQMRRDENWIRTMLHQLERKLSTRTMQ